MKERQFTLEAADGHRIFAVEWLPEHGNVRGVLQISHGMAEHCLRYRDFAQYLNQRGIAVYAHDHRGHGQSVSNGEVIGHYADSDGWNKVVADVHQLNREIARLQPQQPIILLGHSMGSFIARAYVLKHADTLAAVVVSATGVRYGGIAKLARAIARWDARRIGAHKPSKLMAKLSFGTFNLQFLPARTAFDWLSRDSKQVDAYLADPLCGFDCSAQLWVDLFGGIIDFERAEADGSALPRGLPALLVAGTKDPTSMGGLGMKQLAKRYQAAGMADVSVKLYKGGRHELLNETNNAEVYADLASWIDTHCQSPASQPLKLTAAALA